jgi:hypothetical protein
MSHEMGQNDIDEDAPTAAHHAYPMSNEGPRNGELEGRIAFLEREVSDLRSKLSRTRRMVKQAILLKLEADDDDDDF